MTITVAVSRSQPRHVRPGVINSRCLRVLEREPARETGCVRIRSGVWRSGHLTAALLRLAAFVTGHQLMVGLYRRRSDGIHGGSDSVQRRFYSSLPVRSWRSGADSRPARGTADRYMASAAARRYAPPPEIKVAVHHSFRRITSEGTAVSDIAIEPCHAARIDQHPIQSSQSGQARAAAFDGDKPPCTIQPVCAALCQFDSPSQTAPSVSLLCPLLPCTSSDPIAAVGAYQLVDHR
jgi:hypothetical protein